MSALPSEHPSDYSTLTLNISKHVAEVSLNRPEAANAMNAPMWSELEHCFKMLDRDEAVRVVILAAHGRHFCSGIDLAMLSGLTPDDGDPARASERLRTRIRELQDNLSVIESCRKPVLAAVQGACLGGGVDIVSCCDMRYATVDARFAIREIDVGLVADVGSLQRLPHIIGEGLVRELAFTGREVRGDEAATIGLVNRAFDDQDKMMTDVRRTAATIASKSPLAIRGTKQVLHYTRTHSTADALDYVATWNSAMLSFADVRKAIAAAKSGDPPAFED